jgi:hypothetical protein
VIRPCVAARIRSRREQRIIQGGMHHGEPEARRG